LWTQAEASVGVGVDSFYEYLLKSYMLFGDERHLSIFEEAYAAVEANLRLSPWYVEAGMSTGNVLGTRYDSLMSFWPGIQALYGDIEVATTTHDAFYKVWRHYGFTPEGFDVRLGTPIAGQSPYPLRPELIESTYVLYKATGDVSYIAAGRDFLASLRLLKTRCGYAQIADVSTQTLQDKMESFFLSETLKYLYLLFDAALDRENIVDGGPYPYVFTTERQVLLLSFVVVANRFASGARPPSQLDGAPV
jgi:mannosidase alpha-like ER degradation enhancer 2